MLFDGCDPNIRSLLSGYKKDVIRIISTYRPITLHMLRIFHGNDDWPHPNSLGSCRDAISMLAFYICNTQMHNKNVIRKYYAYVGEIKVSASRWNNILKSTYAFHLRFLYFRVAGCFVDAQYPIVVHHFCILFVTCAPWWQCLVRESLVSAFNEFYHVRSEEG